MSTRLQQLIEQARARAQAQQPIQVAQPTRVATMKVGNLEYNAEQAHFVRLATSGASCVLIGAAGTGKTTCMRGVVAELLQRGNIPALQEGHKHLLVGSPGIVACSFTRRAVRNLARSVRAELPPWCCTTIHALLEYEPVLEEFITPEGEVKERKVFKPMRTALRPLDPSIRVIIIDEASMVGGSPFPQDSYLLYNQLVAACPHAPQFIFLGDINQLPPVFGSAILGYKMLELPVIQLTQVYRQAQLSPIIRLAHRILSGVPIKAEELPSLNESCADGTLTVHPWKKRLGAEDALLTLAKFFRAAYKEGKYSPEEDMILIPYNKACGTLELNKHIANTIARAKGRITYEVIAGFNKVYISVGDRILVDKMDAVVTRVERNADFVGMRPQKESEHLDYWGYNSHKEQHLETSLTDQDVDDLLGRVAEEVVDRKTAASHRIYFKREDSVAEDCMDAAGEVNSLLLSYALTVHKSQGSEWRKVFVCLHQSHATMLSRELLYTAVTRAKQELYLICEPNSLVNGILSQRIRGNTLEEKAAYFQGLVTSSTSNQNEGE